MPNEKIPSVLFPAADPALKLHCAIDVATAFVLLEYVNLFVVVVLFPKAKMPTEQFPVAAPLAEEVLADVVTAFVSPEYVYLFLTEVVAQTQL